MEQLEPVEVEVALIAVVPYLMLVQVVQVVEDKAAGITAAITTVEQELPILVAVVGEQVMIMLLLADRQTHGVVLVVLAS
tara:strand:+ start:272 stop:511 length:240 start_codon:yes stop_codon:yes gene_type:complete